MKTIKKIIFTIMITILSITGIKAEEYAVRRIPFTYTYYAIFDGVDRIHIFDGETFRINDNLAYCIEPGVNLYSNTYYKTDDLNITNLPQEKIDKLKLIAYYGYSYNLEPHREELYYMATQELIWKLITGRDTYWVRTRDVNGERVNIDRYKNNIMNLVDTHNVLPSFANQEFEVELGKTYIINDENGVLGRFKLKSPKNNILVNSRRITITPESLADNGEIELITNLYTDKDFYVFYHDDSQKLMSVEGQITPITTKFKIKVIANPKIKITKIDAETKKTVKQSGIKFKIKNLDDNNYICENDACTYETNEEGIIVTKNKFEYGNYQIEEVSEYIKGYLVNDEPLKFTIDDNSNYLQKDNDLYLEYQFENQSIKGSVELSKVGEKPIFNGNQVEYQDYYLNNVVFNLYANDDIFDSENNLLYQSNEFIDSTKTIDDHATFEELPLGKYCLKEVSTVDFHILDKEPKCFTIDQDNPIVKITLKNYLPKGTLDFTKIDEDTNEPLVNAKIAIYNDKNELLLTGTTNDNGKIIIKNIPIGRYYYTEVEAPDGYNLNSQKNYFEIKDDNQKISTNLVNEKYIVPNTKRNIKYHKEILSILLFGIGYLLITYHEKKL